jgi:hypothetical protein
MGDNPVSHYAQHDDAYRQDDLHEDLLQQVGGGGRKEIYQAGRHDRDEIDEKGLVPVYPGVVNHYVPPKFVYLNSLTGLNLCQSLSIDITMNRKSIHIAMKNQNHGLEKSIASTIVPAKL